MSILHKALVAAWHLPWNYPDVSIASTRGKRTCIIAFTAYVATNSTNIEAGFTFLFFEAALLSFRSASIRSASRPSSHSQLHFIHCSFFNQFRPTVSDPLFRPLENMLAQAGTYMLKAKMQALRDLYASRHYTQCASFGERLLGDINDKVCKSNSTPRTFHEMKVSEAGATREKQMLTNDRSIPSTPLI